MSETPTPKKSCCTPSASQVQPSVQSSATTANRADTNTPANGCQEGTTQGPGGLDFVQVKTSEPITYANRGNVENMIHIEAGEFLMGTDSDEQWEDDGEGPIRKVTVKSFYISPTTVSNAEFQTFINDTGYKTDAEKFGWSFVFHTHLSKKYADSLRAKASVPGLPWWVAVPGAQWNHPYGERSTIKKIMDHPVVHVSWNDAVAYCDWAGYRLPFEAEWEYAARGGKEQKMYPWGDQLEPLGKHKCNIWQGKFPETDSAEDGFAGTCPVNAFPPNGYGLHNVSGNVWEWITEWFDPTWHIEEREETRMNPIGPLTGNYTHKLQRGGSYLCHDSYCNRYRVAARTGNMPDSATTNNGFRVARDVK